MSKKTINGSFKKKRCYFSQVSNTALRDANLSLKAKGLYSLIQSYVTIEGFTLYKNTLRKSCPEGNTAFESTWKELKDKGYLLQEKHQKSDGTFYYLYELLDIPVHTPVFQGVDDAGGGKGGSYSNTDLSNTDLNNTERINGANQRFPLCGIFLREYEDYWGTTHPEVAPESLEEKESVIQEVYGDYNLDEQGYVEVIHRYFKTKFPSADVDHRLWHFATKGVLVNRCLEVGCSPV